MREIHGKFYWCVPGCWPGCCIRYGWGWCDGDCGSSSNECRHLVQLSLCYTGSAPAIVVLISTPAPPTPTPPNRVSINTFAFGRCPSTHAHMLYSYSCSYNDFGAPASSILYANLMMGGLHFMHKWLRVDLFRTAAWIDTWTRWRNITNLQKWKSWGKTR